MILPWSIDSVGHYRIEIAILLPIRDCFTSQYYRRFQRVSQQESRRKEEEVAILDSEGRLQIYIFEYMLHREGTKPQVHPLPAHYNKPISLAISPIPPSGFPSSSYPPWYCCCR